MEMEASQLLLEVRKLIEDEGRWTQGESARNGSGERVSIHSPDATCFCLQGAILLIIDRCGFSVNDQVHWCAERELLSCIQHITGQRQTIIQWNDEDGRRHSDVLELLEECARTLEKKTEKRVKEGA